MHAAGTGKTKSFSKQYGGELKATRPFGRERITRERYIEWIIQGKAWESVE